MENIKKVLERSCKVMEFYKIKMEFCKIKGVQTLYCWLPLYDLYKKYVKLQLPFLEKLVAAIFARE